MKALLRHPALHWALALVVGGVFLYACWDKILEPRKFAAIVYQYQVSGPTAGLGFLDHEGGQAHESAEHRQSTDLATHVTLP